MANPFSKGWKYLMSSLDSKIDENADPKVQIKQASDAAKKQHQEITEQASRVIGNKKQLELKIDRLLKSQQEYQSQAREALNAADKAAADGDEEKAQRFSETAELIASQLVGVENELEQAKEMHSQAEQSAQQAQAQVKESEARLKEQMSEVRRLESQADQAKMQEKTTEAVESMNTSVKPDASTPTLDGVRDKIEQRYANALGAQELSKSSASDAMAEISSNTSTNDIKAASKLDEIRASMSAESQSQSQLTAESESATDDNEPESDSESESEQPAADNEPTADKE